jgi:hypothetical protein
MKDRVVKAKIPVKVYVIAALLGVATIAFVFFATRNLSNTFTDARMTGTVVAKEFVPAKGEEFQVTMGREGGVSAQRVEGEFILTVDVPQRDGTVRPFKVWMPNREQFEAINVGDSFDVGPRLVHEPQEP